MSLQSCDFCKCLALAAKESMPVKEDIERVAFIRDVIGPAPSRVLQDWF